MVLSLTRCGSAGRATRDYKVRRRGKQRDDRKRKSKVLTSSHVELKLEVIGLDEVDDRHALMDVS
jgi:hypothetical protein